MARQSQFLSILLLLQVSLAAILFFTESDSGAFVSNQKLLDLSFDALNKIVIEEAGNKNLVIEKQDKHWKLPGYFDFPAADDKVNRVLGKLFDANLGWPVATTESAEKRFKVAKDEFERKLAFSTANASETLYLGTSPGFKKIHVRVDGQNNIYGIDFSAYQASTKAIDWADQNVLHVPREEIAALEMPGFVIKRDNDRFQVEGLADGEEGVQTEIDGLITQVSTIGFQDVLGKSDDPSYQLGSPALDFTLVKKDGQRIGFRYGQLKDQEDFVLKPSTSEYYFKIPKYSVEGLKGFERAKLVKAAAPKIPAEAAEEPKEPVVEPATNPPGE
ncbi:MAG: DUF4340 domain-containing protein [Gammaproteobacteria bacterium]